MHNNDNYKKRIGYPPGTKPSTIDFAPCNHWSQKPGDDLDHLRSDCPFTKLSEKEKKSYYVAKQKMYRVQTLQTLTLTQTLIAAIARAEATLRTHPLHTTVMLSTVSKALSRT